MMLYFYVSIGVVLLCSVGCAWRGQSQSMTVQPWKTFSHLLAWYVPYVIFPVLALLIYGTFAGIYHLVWSVPTMILLILCAYARFIEPQCLRVQYHRKTAFLNAGQAPVKIALIADLHIGLFSGQTSQLDKIIRKINSLDVDMLIVAGDWSYEPNHAYLHEAIQQFKQVNVPMYSVLGNHDEQCPGPPIRELLQRSLAHANIEDIEQGIIEFPAFYLVGIGDLWAGKADMHLLPLCPSDKPYIIVSHNPDTAEMVPALAQKVCMLSGHTHGGQIAVPYFTQRYLQNMSQCGHIHGWYQHRHCDLFVTVGTGMVGVPFRFRTPPTIDVIEFTT
ncbi:MAG: metallophosphoesterase [Acinetobacter sp.]|nr:metallophosphoesterase [Acinetobacter sp.]